MGEYIHCEIAGLILMYGAMIIGIWIISLLTTHGIDLVSVDLVLAG